MQPNFNKYLSWWDLKLFCQTKPNGLQNEQVLKPNIAQTKQTKYKWIALHPHEPIYTNQTNAQGNQTNAPDASSQTNMVNKYAVTKLESKQESQANNKTRESQTNQDLKLLLIQTSSIKFLSTGTNFKTKQNKKRETFEVSSKLQN